MSIRINLISFLILLGGFVYICYSKEYNFFPWIFFVFGISQIPRVFLSENKLSYIQSIFLFCGLTLLFELGFFWPGILILVGINMVLGGFKHKEFHQTRSLQDPKKKITYVTYD